MDDHFEQLTPREREVLELATSGLTNGQIAEQLGLSHNAVRFHLKRVHAKLDTGGDRSALAGWRKWVSGLWFVFGPTKLGTVAPVIAIAVAGIGLTGAAILYFPAGGGTPAAAATPDASGRYPNGCPASYSVQPDIPTLADYAVAFNLPVR